MGRCDSARDFVLFERGPGCLKSRIGSEVFVAEISDGSGTKESTKHRPIYRFDVVFAAMVETFEMVGSRLELGSGFDARLI